MRSVFFTYCVAIVFFVSFSCRGEQGSFYKVKYPFLDLTLSVHNSFQLRETYEDTLFTGGFVRFVDSVHTEPGKGYPSPWASNTDTLHINKKELLAKPGAAYIKIMRQNQWNLSLYAGMQMIKQDTLVSYGIAQARDSLFRIKYFRDQMLWAMYRNEPISYSEEIKNGKRLLKIAFGNSQFPSVIYAGLVGRYWLHAWFAGDEKDSRLLQQMWEQSFFD